MTNPRKKFRFKRHGNNSLQFWKDGQYVGSATLEELCQFVTENKTVGIKLELAQKLIHDLEEKIRSSGINGGNASGGLPHE